MGVFNDIQLVGDNILNTRWVKYYHFGIPDEPETLRWLARAWMLMFGHCLQCTALSGCYFAKSKLPTGQTDEFAESNLGGLLHDKCHCAVIDVNVSGIAAKAVAFCSIDKFINYIFSSKFIKNGKKKLFNLLGYDVEDSYNLRDEYEKQALKKYLTGQYTIGSRDQFGQNINIEINLVNKYGQQVQFVSGWKVYPNGQITCNTPLGG